MKIANKISLSFLITAVILTTVAASVFYIIAKKNLQDGIYAHLNTTVQSRANHIETFLSEHREIVVIMADSALVEALLEAVISNDLDSGKLTKEAILELKEFVKIEKDFYEIFVLNPDGKIIISTNESNIGLDKSSDAYFLGGKKEPYIKDAYYSTTTGKRSIAISAPILDNETRKHLGVLVARLELTSLNEITTNRTGLGKTGEIYVVNKHGYMITPSRFKKDTSLKQKVDTKNTRKYFEDTKKYGRKTHPHEPLIYTDYRGMKVLGLHEYIYDMQWCLCAEIDEKEALAPLAKIKILFVIIMTFVPVATLLIGIFVSKLISGPIKKLHLGTEIIGEGNLDYKVGTDSKDEIGQLSRAFDNMANHLKQSTTSIDNLNKEITERKKAECKQDELIKKVDNINKELKDFASIVSHDLKAPLRGIKTLANWILSDCSDKLSDEANEQMNLLLERVERMHNLIEGALQYSRAGRAEGKRVQVNLNDFVPEIINMVVPPENITVTIEDELPVFECEEIHIMQIFQNLLSNAIKYMDKPQGRIQVGCVEQDGFWKFSIADNGPGIEEKHFERIFKIFQALSTSPDFEGTGVGLTVVKKLIELNHGKIWVESKVGEGSTFFFTLPKQEIETSNEKLQAHIAC